MSALIEDTDKKTTVAYHMRETIRLRSSTVRNLIHSQDPNERHQLFDKYIDYTENYQLTRKDLTASVSNEREESILEHIDSAYVRVNAAMYNTM